MTNYKNDLPLYAEQITINQNQEVEQIQQILSQFKQLVPDKFIELKQLKRMCSTAGWKEPTCERYNCLINSKWSQVDISHTLLEELKLTKAKNIPYPVHISPAVQNRGVDCYLAYNIENEEEIFLEKPFTVESLEEDINTLLENIEEQKGKNNQLTAELKELQKVINKWRDQFTDETKRLNEEMVEVQITLQAEKEQLNNDWKKRHQQELNQKDNEITRLESEVRKIKKERDDRPKITLHQWNNDYSKRPTLTELNQVKQELQKEKGWWDKWMNDETKIISGGPFFDINFDSQPAILYLNIEIKRDLVYTIEEQKNTRMKEFKKIINFFYKYYLNKP